MDFLGFTILVAPFAMVVGIVWVRSQAQIEEKRIAAAERSRASQPATAQDDGRVEELEERVRVLERIVTDGGYDLAHKIEALRHDRPVAAIEARAEPERLS